MRRSAYLYSVEATAEILGVAPAEVVKLIEAGHLRVVEPQPRRMIHDADLEEYLADPPPSRRGFFRRHKK